MMFQVSKQASTNAKGHRINDTGLIRFALDLWIMAGRRTYEIVNANLPEVFPAPRSIEIKLSKYQMAVIEGNKFSCISFLI